MSDLMEALDGPERSSHRVVTGLHTGRRFQRPVLWLTMLTICVFFAWAANAPLEQVTRGMGKVAPLSRGQIIQSLEGGIINNIAVLEGEEVDAGQTLAELDDTRFRTEFEDLKGRTIAHRAALSRLHAELAGEDKIRFDPDVAEHRGVVEAETQLFQARRQKLAETTSSLKDRLELAKRELELVGPMVARGAVSTVDEIQLQRNIADLSGQLSDVRNTYNQEINDQIAKRGPSFPA